MKTTIKFWLFCIWFSWVENIFFLPLMLFTISTSVSKALSITTIQYFRSQGYCNIFWHWKQKAAIWTVTQEKSSVPKTWFWQITRQNYRCIFTFSRKSGKNKNIQQLILCHGRADQTPYPAGHRETAPAWHSKVSTAYISSSYGTARHYTLPTSLLTHWEIPSRW